MLTVMSAKQSQDKLDKRAIALRDNLRKRKELQKAEKELSKKDKDDGNAERA
jgi:hypothetical protein